MHVNRMTMSLPGHLSLTMPVVTGFKRRILSPSSKMSTLLILQSLEHCDVQNIKQLSLRYYKINYNHFLYASPQVVASFKTIILLKLKVESANVQH